MSGISLARQSIVISASLSIFGSLCVLVCCIICQKWRNRLQSAKKLLFFICLCDFISSINFLYSAVDASSSLCTFQASIFQLFELAGVLWNGAIALELYFLVKNTSDYVTKEISIAKFKEEALTRRISYHCVIWFFCISTTLALIIFNLGGPAGFWCWIVNPLIGLLFGYLPLWIALLLILICNAKAALFLYQITGQANNDSPKNTDHHQYEGDDETHLSIFSPISRSLMAPISGSSSNVLSQDKKKVREDQVSSETRPNILRLMLIPVLFIIIRVPGTIRRSLQFMGTVNDDDPSSSYDMLRDIQAVCDPIHGFIGFTCQIFFDSKLRSEIYDILDIARILNQFSSLCCRQTHKSKHKEGKVVQFRDSRDFSDRHSWANMNTKNDKNYETDDSDLSKRPTLDSVKPKSTKSSDTTVSSPYNATSLANSSLGQQMVFMSGDADDEDEDWTWHDMTEYGKDRDTFALQSPPSMEIEAIVSRKRHGSIKAAVKFLL